MEEKKGWKGFKWRVKVREVGEIVKCQVLELKIKDKVDLEYRGTVVFRYPGNTGFRIPVPYLSQHMSSPSEETMIMYATHSPVGFQSFLH